MQQINYTNLETSSIKEKGTLKKRTNPLLGVLVLIGFIPVLLIIFLVFSLNPVLSSLFILLGIVGLVIYGTKRSKRFNIKMDKFAQDNGWSRGADSPLIPAFQKQNYISEKAILSGTLDRMPFWLYSCRPPVFRPGEQRNDTAVYLLSVEFPKQVPELLCIPAGGMWKSIFDPIAKNSFGMIPLSLEGDFDQGAQIYIVPGQQINSLEYITPDVMAVIIDQVSDFLVYSGNYVSISTSQEASEEMVARLLDSSQRIIKEIKEKQNIENSQTT